MSSSAALQKAVFDALTASSEIAALVGGGIYDGMPQSGNYPCITFGASDALPDEADCIEAWEEVLTLHAWSQDQSRTRPCKQICAVVRDVLHEADLTLDDPYALHEARVTRVSVRLDPDGITAHGLVELTAQVQRV